MATIPEALDLALRYHHAGHLQQAEQIYRQIVQVAPNHAQAWCCLGTLYQPMGRLDESAEYLRHATELEPGYAEAHCNLGVTLTQQNKFDEALASFRSALRYDPNHIASCNNLGALLKQLGHSQEAETVLRQALRLQPDYAEAYYNLAGVFTDLFRLDEAESAYRQAIRLRPNHVEARINLGMVLQDRRKFAEALQCYEQALQLRPNYANSHWNRALTYLVMGDFERGWQDYEWRWRCPAFAHNWRPFPQPIWDGSPFAGKTILLHTEQGLGDAIQFIRYASLVKQRCGTVIVECQHELQGLFATCPGIDNVISRGSPLPHFDVHAPLLSLPRIFGTTLTTIPANIPYLSADPELIRPWGCVLDKETRKQGDKEKAESAESGPAIQHSALSTQHSALDLYHSPLTTHHSPFRVGIAWQGDPKSRVDRRRSVPLSLFEPLARLPGVRLVSMQHGPGVEQLATVTYRESIIDLGSRFESFADLAAALMNLDLVVTVDTAVVHCAGALGVPVWTALPFYSDWRWLVDREDSPWYPSMRLFRQSRLGRWEDVFERIAEGVAGLLSAGIKPAARQA